MGSKKRATPVAKKKIVKKKATEAPLVPIKIGGFAFRKIKANAKMYAGGNFSAWMRYASIHYRPKRGEVVELSTMLSSKYVRTFARKKKR